MYPYTFIGESYEIHKKILTGFALFACIHLSAASETSGIAPKEVKLKIARICLTTQKDIEYQFHNTREDFNALLKQANDKGYLNETSSLPGMCEILGLIHLAAGHAPTDILQTLLTLGLNPNETDSNEQRPLFYAEIYTHKDNIEILKQNGAQPSKNCIHQSAEHREK